MTKLRLLISFLVGLSLSLILAWGAVGQATVSTEAQVATQRGFQFLGQGEAVAALQQWQIAESAYRKQQSLEGIVGSQVNQNLALQQLGLYPRACATLVQALSLTDQVCQVGEETDDLWLEKVKAISSTAAHLAGLNSLGVVLTALGKPDVALQVLQTTASLTSVPPSLQSQLSLSIANAESDRVLTKRGQYEATDDDLQKAKFFKQLQQSAEAALRGYEQAQFGDARTTVLSKINALQLLVELREWTQEIPATVGLQKQVATELPQRLEQAETLQFSALPDIEAVYAQLSLARSLRRGGNPKAAKQWAIQALHLSEKLGNFRAQSYAWGILAGQAIGVDAVPLYQKALALSRSIQAWDVSYAWEQALGKWAFQQGNLSQSAEYYRAAVEDLDRVRGNLLAINPSAQFSFEDSVELVYREYLQLLFSSPTPNLEQAIAVSQKLQRAQLENYLQCGRLDLVALDQVQDPGDNSTKFYVIDGTSQLDVVVQSADQKLHHYSVDRELVQSAARLLLVNIQDEDFQTIPPKQFLPLAQRLYQELIAPARSYLPTEGTLVFALDYALQSVPMGLLHDGHNYLIQRYSIATTLGTQLRRPLLLKQFNSLVAGVSQTAPSFNTKNALSGLQPLPEVEEEIRSISAMISAKVLLNENFTVAALQEQIQQTNHPIVHLTTHGQFSSDPDATFLLAWDQPITVRTLRRLVRERLEKQNSIELLVLSACQTAKGDRRSALGLAGVAAQAGARSTVASLWLVDAESTAQLVQRFYEGLRDGKTKAEALRQAELMLLARPETSHPYYWAAFSLLGGWL